MTAIVSTTGENTGSRFRHCGGSIWDNAARRWIDLEEAHDMQAEWATEYFLEEARGPAYERIAMAWHRGVTDISHAILAAEKWVRAGRAG